MVVLLDDINCSGCRRQTPWAFYRRRIPCRLVNTVFPPFTAAIVVCAVLAAIMSTCDSVLHVAGTTIARDFYQRLVPGASEKKLLSVSRASILIVGAIGLIIALLQTSIIFDLLIFIWNFVANAIAVPLIASFYWKRANETGAVASMVAGMVVTVIWSKRSALWHKRVLSRCYCCRCRVGYWFFSYTAIIKENIGQVFWSAYGA